MLEQLNRLSGGNAEVAGKLIKAANTLLQRQFLYSGDRGVAQAYELITHSKYQLYFEYLFDAVGYRLHRRESESWVGIVPDSEVIAAPRLKLDETLILLVLCVIWQEAVNQGDIEDRAVVRSDTGEIDERHVTILGKQRVERRRLVEILEKFKRRGLVSFGEEEPDTREFEVFIRPMIRLIAGDDAAEMISRHAGHEIIRIEAEQHTEAEIQAIDAQLDQEAEI